MIKSYFLTLTLLVFFNFSAASQDCTQDIKANEAKTKLEEGKGHGCSYAAQFYAYLCECKNKPRTAKQAENLKATLEHLKNSYNQSDKCEGMGNLPAVPNCKVGAKTGAGSSGGSSNDAVSEFRRSMANMQKIHGRLNAARERAKRVSGELQKLTEISSNASPQQIMQQYNQNMARMNELESELKYDIANSNFNTGVDIINDYNTGNHEGAVYGGLGLLGQMYENNQAKKELSAQKAALEEKKRKRMLAAALQMIKELREKRDLYNQYAGSAISADRETYFSELADYYNNYANHVNYGFSYSHSRWADYSKQPPQKTSFETVKSNPTASQYASAAERKYENYLKNNKTEFIEGAMQHMNAAIALNPRKSDYHLKLSTYYEPISKLDALDAYIVAFQLNRSHYSEERYRKLAMEFVKEVTENFYNFVPTMHDENLININPNWTRSDNYKRWYLQPKEYLTRLISNDIFTAPIVLPDPVSEDISYHSPLDLLLNLSAKDNISRFQKLNLELPKYKSQNRQLMTKTLHNAIVSRGHNISPIIKLGADPDLKIRGKNAIDLAIEKANLDAYNIAIAHSSRPESYKKKYDESALPIIERFIAASFDASILNEIQDEETQEKTALWLMDNFDVIYILQGTANAMRKTEALKKDKEPEYKGSGHLIGSLEIVKNKSSEKVNNNFRKILLDQMVADHSELLEIEMASWISNGALDFGNNLFPPEDLVTENSLSEKKIIEELDSIGCRLCLERVEFEIIVERIIAFLGSEKAGAEKGSIDLYKAAFISYKNTGKFKSSLWHPSSEQIITAYNKAAAANSYPAIDMLQGKIMRPLGLDKETFAHIALMKNRFHIFKAMNERMPLGMLQNRDGESVLDYLQVMAVENPEAYVRYALLPGIKEVFDWEYTFKGKNIVQSLEEVGDYSTLAELGASGVIQQDLTPYAYEMAKKGKFKEIARMAELGILDIHTQHPEGGNLLHELLDYMIHHEMMYYKEDGWYYNILISFPTVELAREKYALDKYLALDLKERNRYGRKPNKVIKFYWKDYESKHYNVREETYDEWKDIL